MIALFAVLAVAASPKPMAVASSIYARQADAFCAGAWMMLKISGRSDFDTADELTMQSTDMNCAGGSVCTFDDPITIVCPRPVFLPRPKQTVSPQPYKPSSLTWLGSTLTTPVSTGTMGDLISHQPQ